MDDKKLNDPLNKGFKEDPDQPAPHADVPKTEPAKHKSFKEKIKDALQEWSNDNERDIQEDDSTPLRSGL